jgi:hypothetical protein
LKIELSKSYEFCLKRIWNRTPDKEEDVLPLSELTAANLADIDLVVDVSHPDVVRNYGKLILEHSDLFVTKLPFNQRNFLHSIRLAPSQHLQIR